MICCFKGEFRVTSPRGYRTLNGKQEYHGGMDIVALGPDKSVYAVADGVIDATPYEANGFGYYVRQLLPNGMVLYLSHMAKGSIVVKTGQSIKVGEKLGVMGSTGNSTGAHTHIELRPNKTSRESLDIAEFLGIPNKIGVYEYKPEITPYEAACKIEDKAGLEKQTMSYLWKYKYANDLMLKLWKAME